MPDDTFSKMQTMIQQIVLNAMNSAKPSGVYYGTVISTSPLQIQLDQKTILSSEFLVLSSMVQDFAVDVTTLQNNHTEKYTIHLGLNADEKVILMRVQGGQQFLVLDKVRG